MPIISISINESLKKFINRLVTKNKYSNKSKLVRDAILRLMSSDEISSLEGSGGVDTSTLVFPENKSIVGNMIVVLPNDISIQKKLNKVEREFQEHFVSKNQHYANGNISIFYVFEGTLQEFQKAVVEINGINELNNFRYLIIN